jgi:hypothetical protein
MILSASVCVATLALDEVVASFVNYLAKYLPIIYEPQVPPE